MKQPANKSSVVRPPARARTEVEPDSPFYVPPALDVLGRTVSRFRRFWLWLGSVESLVLSPQIAECPGSRPIYVCGLARSGSTLLHEVIAAHPSVATHRLKDYPFVSTPYWWRRASALIHPTPVRERPHRDRMMVNSESPDAIEEMLWMAFFPKCHDPGVDNRLQSWDRNWEFESYYRNHVCKLLLAERASRYAAKANYHVARLGYLARLFPEARFVIPIRAPEGHIASLVRQHQWFSEGHRQSPQSLALMRRAGHFEFGLDRRPINLGDFQRVREIESAWLQGREILGWAHYWDMVYRYVADLLDSEPHLRKASIVVRFEELCASPPEVLGRVFDHCGLTEAKALIDKIAPTIRFPNYYQSSFTVAEQESIEKITKETAHRWSIMR